MGVLVAISIPVFTAQLEKAREATDLANVRSAYAELTADYLTNGGSTASIQVPVTQKQSGWQGTASTIANNISVSARTTGSYVVTIDASGAVSVN